jgi:hypothetical protein
LKHGDKIRLAPQTSKVHRFGADGKALQ